MKDLRERKGSSDLCHILRKKGELLMSRDLEKNPEFYKLVINL